MHLSHPDVPLPEPIMEREPVRVPLWIASLASGAIGVSVDLLMGGDWRIAVAGFLATIPPVLFGVEIARGRAWSPASVWLATVQARRDGASPPDADRLDFPPPP